MKKSVLVSMAAALLAVAGVFLASSEATARPAKQAKSSSAKTQYVVVKIGDEYKCITSTSVNDEKKRLKEEYDSALKKWNQDKKDDPKAEKPAKKTMQVLKSGFKTQEDANRHITDLKERDEEKAGGKGPAKDKPVF